MLIWVQKKISHFCSCFSAQQTVIFFIPSICFKVYTCQIFWKVAVLIVLGVFLQSKSAFVLWFPGSAVRGFHWEIFHDLQLYSFMLKSYGIRFGGSLFKVCYLCMQHTPLRPAANQRWSSHVPQFGLQTWDWDAALDSCGYTEDKRSVCIVLRHLYYCLLSLFLLRSILPGCNTCSLEDRTNMKKKW